MRLFLLSMLKNRVPARVVLLALVAGLIAPAGLLAQDLHPSRRPSPMGMARTFVDDAYVRVVYSRPYQRGRDNIFGTEESGAVVPFGQLWRFGANEATEITVAEDVKVAGETLPAGTYSVFVTPGAEEWTFHFNSVLGLNGTGRFDPETGDFENAYSADNDVVTVSAPTAKTEEEVDQLTITFEEVTEGAEMVVGWIHTEVRLPLAASD
jgi:hypothetical protein